MVVTPVFQNGAGQVMTELPSLLTGVLFLGLLIRFVENRSKRLIVGLGLLCCLTLLIKGTGICLVPAPFVVLLLGRRWKHATRAVILSAVALAVITAAWYLVLGPAGGLLVSWAGIGSSAPWSITPCIRLLGPGIAALAVLGMFTLVKKPTSVVIASTAIYLSTAAISLFLRAIAEPRHWILALPCVLLLAMEFFHRLFAMRSIWGRRAAVAAASAPALASPLGIVITRSLPATRASLSRSNNPRAFWSRRPGLHARGHGLCWRAFGSSDQAAS